MAKKKVSGSVHETQEVVFRILKQLAQARAEIQRLEKECALAMAAHKEQIRISLQSELHSEREAAEAIARWWEVEASGVGKKRPRKGAPHG